ncbi:MAG: hypothetical protein HYW33_00820 [Candidatus Blackburnbacteria bacterium]|nr:hypothetical protein [Candidatus Blackburnbacteria bacterium]
MPLEQKVWDLVRNLSEPTRQESLRLINLAGRTGLVGGGFLFKQLSREWLDGLSQIAAGELVTLEQVRAELSRSVYSSGARKAVEEYDCVTRALGVAQPMTEAEIERAVRRIMTEAGLI